MIQTTITKQLVEEKSIDYENGISVYYTLTDNILSYYVFKNKRHKLSIVNKKLLKELCLNHWSEHRDLLEKEENEFKITTEKDLLVFNDFDNLYYVGHSIDGMLANNKSEFLSTLLIFDNGFCSNYLDIETSQKECEEILNTLPNEYVTNKKIEEIKYYNQNEDKEEHYTISFNVLLPQTMYNEILGNETYLSDEHKVKIFKLIKK